MTRLITFYWAHILLGMLILSLVALSITWLDVPPIYRLTHHNPFMLYRGYVVLGLVALLACFHRWAIAKMIWLSMQIHRWVSALVMLSVIGVDASMHVLNIPHMEGWWMPLIGSSGAISSLIFKYKTKNPNPGKW